jgi:peptidoglycan/LPS O-acetylase OafA/YrhL
VPLVVTLAIGAGSLPALLSTRPLVYLGHISFGLYMVHEIVHTAWIWATQQFEILLVPSWWAKAVVAGLVMGALVVAAALYHFVEEPARLWMRRMVDVRSLPVDLRTEKAAHGTLKSVRAG